MNKNDNYVRLEFKSLPENVALARVLISSLVAQVDTTLNDLEEIKVAVSEAVSNCIIHGYKEQNNGIIIIEDKGIGIEDIEQAMTPAYSTNPERMGLGFVFMKSFMDEVQVESEVGQGTKVVLEKKLVDAGSCALNAI